VCWDIYSYSLEYLKGSNIYQCISTGTYCIADKLTTYFFVVFTACIWCARSLKNVWTIFSSETVGSLTASSVMEVLLLVKGAIFSAKKSQQSSSLNKIPFESVANCKENQLRSLHACGGTDSCTCILHTFKKKCIKMDMVVVNRACVVKVARILDTAGLISMCSLASCDKNCCPSFSTSPIEAEAVSRLCCIFAYKRFASGSSVCSLNPMWMARLCA